MRSYLEKLRLILVTKNAKFVGFKASKDPLLKKSLPHSLTVQVIKKHQRLDTYRRDPLVHVAKLTSSSNSRYVFYKLCKREMMALRNATL